MNMKLREEEEKGDGFGRRGGGGHATAAIQPTNPRDMMAFYPKPPPPETSDIQRGEGKKESSSRLSKLGEGEKR